MTCDYRLAVATACGVAVLLLLATQPARADDAADLSRVFPFERDVIAEQPGLTRLTLPADVLAATRPDLSDLRLFDAAGREVPFLVDAGAPATDSRQLVRVLDATVVEARRARVERADGPPLFRETYVLEAPPAARAEWELAFEVEAPEFVRHLRVDGVADDGTKQPLVTDESIFRLRSPAASKLRIALPLPPDATDATRARRLEVTIEGEDGDYLSPALHYRTARPLPPPALPRADAGLGAPLESGAEAAARVAPSDAATAVVPLEETRRETRDGRTVIELARPSGVVPDALRLETATGDFSRAVAVWDESAGRGATPLGSATLFRVRGAVTAEERDVALHAARGDLLRIEIDDGDSPALAELRIEALVRQPTLLWMLSGADAPRATLRYGGGRARAPRYDLAGLVPAPGTALDASRAAAVEQIAGAARSGSARLGALRNNPQYDGAPALAFAMRAGAAVDSAPYTHRRESRVTPSPDGLSRLRLEASDLTPARADLADLRVVDATGRQWPYLLQADAAFAWTPLRVSRAERRGSTSIYTLDSAAAPLAIDQLVVEPNVPFVDRAFELRGRAADGTERLLTGGRLTLRAERPRPLSIVFAPARLSALELRIDDGDESPLELDAVRARSLVSELFLVAPQGAYALLLGDPNAAPPRYELERVRDVVLAVRGGTVDAGPLQPNPAYSPRARLLADGQLRATLARVAVWAVLLLAVALLGLVTLRSVRR